MASIRQNVTLGHAPTKAADVGQVTLAAGTKVTIVREWKNHYLVKTAEGKLFNVTKEAVDATG
jgi:SH3-like domain-containing protein